MKHELSVCILIPTLAVLYIATYLAKVGRMHSVCVSSQLLVSVLFFAVPTNTESAKLSSQVFYSISIVIV